MSDIVERLRAHKADIWDWNGHAMKSWDYWRASIAMGDKSSSPRDGFEALIGGYGEDMGEAADEIERLRAALEEIAEMTKPEVRTGAKARPYAEQNIHFRARAALTAKPAAPGGDDPPCTCCGGTGVTYQTERRCACQPAAPGGDA